jgi:hypothetical protein
MEGIAYDRHSLIYYEGNCLRRELLKNRIADEGNQKGIAYK